VGGGEGRGGAPGGRCCAAVAAGALKNVFFSL
jgi:hypothetical protein